MVIISLLIYRITISLVKYSNASNIKLLYKNDLYAYIYFNKIFDVIVYNLGLILLLSIYIKTIVYIFSNGFTGICSNFNYYIIAIIYIMILTENKHKIR